MAKSQSLVMAGINCERVFLFVIIEHKQKQLKISYSNKTRYSFDINNIERS